MVLKIYGLVNPMQWFSFKSGKAPKGDCTQRRHLIKQLLIAMKLTAFFLFSICLTAGANGYSQITLSKKNVPLQKVFKAFQKQSGYDFFYTYEVVEKAGRVTVELNHLSLEKAMEAVLKDKPLTYTITGKTVVIKEKAVPGFMMAVNNAQTAVIQKINGIVKDERGIPLEGVSVVVKSSTRGVSTDTKGEFSVEADIGDILEFSRVGYKAVSLPVSTNNFLVVKMQIEVTAESEVIVVGYGTQKKTNVTGAVSTVNMKDVAGSRAVTNIAQLLQGAVPDLQITYSSGEPGASTKLNIRGTTSIGSGSNGTPLILLDNVPVASLSLINPNDIESVTVLKDAGSAAIYGARSAWGVILLTSKNKGGAKKTSIEYSNNIVFSRPLEVPQKATPLQTVQSFKDMNFTPGTGQDVDDWISLLNDYNQHPSQYGSGYTVQNGIIYPLRDNDIWGEMVSKNAFQQTHNLAISGGTEKTSYRIAGAFTNEDGILITNKDSYKRYNLTGFINSQITPWANAQLSTMYSNANKRFPYTGYAFGMFGAASVLPSYTLVGDSLIDGVYVPYATPKNLIENASVSNNRLDDIRLSGKVTLKIFKGFNVVGEYTYDKTNTVNTAYDKPFNIITLASFVPTPTVTADKAKYYKYNDFTDYHALNIYGNYEKKLDNHLFNLVAGFNQERSYFELLNAQMSIMINPNLPYLDGGTGVIQPDENGFDGFSEYAVQGYFYRFNYAYKGKYLLETTGRYDGSSKFPEGRRWGFFPSVSAGWRVTDEAFMKILKPVLSDLKFRASYGNVGNQSIGNYLFYSGMKTRPASNWADVSGVRYLTLDAPGLISGDFTWEKVTTRNFGVDLGLFSNRFTGSLDIFKRTTTGMLIPGAQLPAVLGANAPLQNTADLKTTGWGLQAMWKDQIGKVNYHFGFTLSDNKAFITKYDINATRLLSQYYTGQQIGEIWGYETDGFYAVEDFEEGSLNSNLLGGKLRDGVIRYQGENPNPGDIKFKDLDKDGKIFTGDNTVDNPGDRKIIGNTNRRYQYGFSAQATWNGFDVSLFIQGVGKRDLFIVNDLTYPYSSNYGTLYSNLLNYWTIDNIDAFYGRIYNLGGGNSKYNKLVQTRLLQNGAYMRLKNITLGYSLPYQWLSRAKINSLRIFVSGDDLLTKKHLPRGVDPELNDQGYGAQYPIMQKMSIGLNLNF